ncbi:MAG: FAD/NAD(P)-binding protein [Acidaminococcaceae bacterium]
MCNCTKTDTLVPVIVEIKAIRQDTADVKTFRVERPEGGQAFAFMPGQCAMLSVPGKGEAIFSITSSPTNLEFMEFSIKRCGEITDYLHAAEVGQQIAIRGPYGNAFPVTDALVGKDILFVAGGIGLAPLRSVINYMLAKRSDYGQLDVVYGARSKEDFVDYEELTTVWPAEPQSAVHLTIDRPQAGWQGNVGFVPQFLQDLQFSPDKTVLVCGPPIMIKLCLAALLKMGFQKTQVYTTLELRMKCGIGKCGRCNIGSKYVCKDGPVFRCDELDELPDEY